MLPDNEDEHTQGFNSGTVAELTMPEGEALGQGDLIPHIEALIFASDKPLPVTEIIELINNAFGFMANRVGQNQVNIALEGIVEKYDSEFYPFEVRQSGGGWQFLTKKQYHKTVAQLNGEKFLKRLSAAALETLAIIAYKQPMTKGEIESIRGVSSDYSVQKLLEKELIIITGRNEKLPGHPLIYATSKTFMDYFGINSPDDMPRIREVMRDVLTEATVIQEGEGANNNLVLQQDRQEAFSKDDSATESVTGDSLEQAPAAAVSDRDQTPHNRLETDVAVSETEDFGNNSPANSDSESADPIDKEEP
ncbi:MAG: SMC-Scp complex subunit ScpB [Chitinophagaceae bacterium]